MSESYVGILLVCLGIDTLCRNGAFTFNYGAVVQVGKIFTWMYIDYAVLPLSLNAKHGFLCLWYFGISPCVEAKTMFNCLYTCTGKAFRRQLFLNRESLHSKLHHLLLLWWWWGSKTKPNQPWCGLLTQEGAEPKCCKLWEVSCYSN